MTVLQIALEAYSWTTQDQFYDELLPQLGAPAWHGRNLDALWDSITSGDINRVNPPFEVVLRGLERCPQDLRSHLRRFAELMDEARREGAAVKVTLLRRLEP